MTGRAYDGGMENFWIAALWSILPTIVVSCVFFYIVRNIINADRNERREYARMDADERRKRGLPPRSADAAEATAAPER